MYKILKNHKFHLLLLLFIVFAVIFLSKKIVFPVGSINYDEPVYIYQAETYAQGRIYNTIPQPQENFQQWFIIDHEGKRFGKYPFGASLIYLVGVLINNIEINLSLLAVFNIYLIYLLAAEFFSKKESFLVALIAFLNPFFIVNSSLILSYTPDLFFLLLTLLFFTKTIKNKNSVSAVLTGFFMSLSFNTRPLTTVAFAVVLIAIGIFYLYKNFSSYFKLFILTIFGFLPLFGGFLLYNKILTGNPLHMPFSLWCSADAIGFGLRTQSWANKIISFNLPEAIDNTLLQLKYIFIYLPLTVFSFLALLYSINNKKCLFLLAFSLLFIASHISLYFFHFIAFTPFIDLYGPVYYLELLPFFSIITFLGLKYLYGIIKNKPFKIIFSLVLFLIILFCVNLNFKKHYEITKIVQKSSIDAEKIVNDKIKNENKNLLVFIGKMPFISEALYLRPPQSINSPSFPDQKVIFARISALERNQKVIENYGKNREILELYWNQKKSLFEVATFKNHLPDFEYVNNQCIEY